MDFLVIIRVATLSKMYLTVTGIKLQRLIQTNVQTLIIETPSFEKHRIATILYLNNNLINI